MSKLGLRSKFLSYVIYHFCFPRYFQTYRQGHWKFIFKHLDFKTAPGQTDENELGMCRQSPPTLRKLKGSRLAEQLKITLLLRAAVPGVAENVTSPNNLLSVEDLCLCPLYVALICAFENVNSSLHIFSPSS